MQAAPSAAPPKGGPKKKLPTKPDPTAAITAGMAAASLKPPVCKRFDLNINFPYFMSPTWYFRDDGKRHVCVDFFGITQHLDNYKVEVSGKTLELFMTFFSRFFDPQRVDCKIANIELSVTP